MKYCCFLLIIWFLGISGGFAQDKVECWGRYEISIPAKVKGNPLMLNLQRRSTGRIPH